MKRNIALFTIGTCVSAMLAAQQDWKQQFEKASDDYFDQVYFHFAPSVATQTGFHQYDGQLEDLSHQNIDAEIAALKRFETRIDAIQPDNTTPASFVPRSDREIVLSNIRGQLLELETIRSWEKNADNYSSICANGAFVLMERKFAPPDDRLRSLIAREKQMPTLLATARANLQNPPRIFTEIAIEQLPGDISFFQHDVPEAFKDAQDPDIKAQFAKTNAAVIAALNDYLDWLKNDLLARSNGDFRIGADTFQKKLLYDEMVDIPLDKLLEIDWTDLHKNQERFRQVAHELDPGKDPRAVLDELGKDHPAPDHLLDAFREKFNGLVAFIRAHHIVTIPSNVQPIVQETPPSCAPPHRPAWTLPAPTSSTLPRPTSMSPSPIPA